MMNNISIIGRVCDVESKTYRDSVTVTHFRLAYPKATRNDVFTCRIISRVLGKPFTAEVGDTVALTGHLTTLGSRGERVCIDVHWWDAVKELV